MVFPRTDGKIQTFREACSHCTSSRSNNFYLVQLWFATHRKKLEEVDFVDEEFLHKKIDKTWRL